MMNPAADIQIRFATVDDAPTVATQRASMFRDMGRTDDASFSALVSDVDKYLRRAIARGEYIAWLAHVTGKPNDVIAGAGALVRRIPPFPMTHADGRFSVAEGHQALIQNVYTLPAWRRRGVAARLMNEIIAWSEREGIESLILHASAQGRSLYEQLGFQSTNEMVYKDPRAMTHR